MSLNSRTLVGRVGKDAEIKAMPSGQKVCNFSVAQDRGWWDKQANAWHPATLWYNCAIWGEAADRAYSKIKRGQLFVGVGVESSRAYIDNAGSPQVSMDFKVETYKTYTTVKDESSEYSDNSRDLMDLSDDEDISF